MPPIRTIGTTPSGLLICCAFTRGSASAAQPRASWQNPVGIPGGGWGKARPWGFPEGGWGKVWPSDSRRGNGDRPTLGVSGWGNWSAPIYAYLRPSTPIPSTSIRGSPPPTPKALWHKARGCASAALPRVQAASRSLPRKGLCRSCPSGGATNKGGMGSCSRVRKRSPPGMYVQTPRPTHTSHTTHSNHRHNPFGVVDIFGLYPG